MPIVQNKELEIVKETVTHEFSLLQKDITYGVTKSAKVYFKDGRVAGCELKNVATPHRIEDWKFIEKLASTIITIQTDFSNKER